jgi:O-antigen ligase
MLPKGLEVLIPIALAIPLGILISLTGSETSMALLLGGFVLLVAFLSTTASLYLLVFSMLLGPEMLFGGLGGGGGGAAGRGVTLRFDDFLLVVIGFVWLAKVALFKGGPSLVRTPLNGPIAFYIATVMFATLIGMLQGRVDMKTGFFYVLKYYEYVFLYFMVVSSVTTQRQARNLIIASLATCFLVTLYALAQIPSGARPSAPFEGETGEPNTLGGYLVFMLAIVGGFLLTPGSVPKPGLFPLVVLLGTGGIALLATLSRSAFLASVVVILVMAGFMMNRKPLVFTFILSGLLTAPLWAPDAVKNRVLYTVTQAPEAGQLSIGGVRVDTSTSDRIRSWQQSIEYWKKSPVWGTGVTGAGFMDAMYPRILTETGMLGMVAFLILLWSIFRVGVAAYQQTVDPFSKGVALGFLVGFLGLVVHAIGANTFLIVRIMEPFWLYAALVVKSTMLLQADRRVERVSQSLVKA